MHFVPPFFSFVLYYFFPFFAIFFHTDGGSTGGLWEQVGKDIAPQQDSSPQDSITVRSSSSLKSHAWCGSSVDISKDGRTVIVGCPGTQYGNLIYAGSAHLYQLDDDNDNNNNDGRGGRTWNETMKWVGKSNRDYFGGSVSIATANTIVAIGDSEGSDSEGMVQVFDGNGNGSGGFELMGSPIDGSISRSSLSADGNQICVADVHGRKVHVYGFDDGDGGASSWKRNFQIDTSTIGEPLGVTLSEDGNKVGFVVVDNDDNYTGARLFGVGDLDEPVYSDDESKSIAVSDDGRVLAVGNQQFDCDGSTFSFCGRLRLFDVTTDNAVQIGDDIVGENEGDFCGYSVDLSRNGKTVVIGCYNKALIATLNESNPDNPIWDIEDAIFVDDTYGYFEAVISSDGETVALGGDNANDGTGAVRVYKRTTAGLSNQISSS